ncbi:hypothetical protein vseg_003198 [Gypsophila vaccaria]
MSITLAKNLHFCFSIIKRPQNHLTNSPNRNSLESPIETVTTTTTRTATIFTKNYNSLFEDTSSISIPPIASPSSVFDPETDYDSLEEELAPVTPDLTAAYASRRFFISSPGRSNSIVDALSLSSLEEKEDGEGPDDHLAEVAGGVAVETYSPDPYLDFRHSMQEMVEARGEVGGAWEYLQELLLSYLSLNPKSTHKYIVRAFADVVVSSMSHINTSSTPCYSSYFGGGHDNSTYVEIFDHAT